MRHITKNGLKLIKSFEGFSSSEYLDTAGLPTIGFGHLIKPNEKVSFKSGITRSQAEELLKADVVIAEKAVSRLITVALNDNQFDALVSFTFNLGSGVLQRSTLRAKVNRAEHEQVPAEFIRWVYVDGRKIPGLIRRRQAEAEHYLA
jgi:lysozyme